VEYKRSEYGAQSGGINGIGLDRTPVAREAYVTFEL